MFILTFVYLNIEIMYEELTKTRAHAFVELLNDA